MTEEKILREINEWARKTEVEINNVIGINRWAFFLIGLSMGFGFGCLWG